MKPKVYCASKLHRASMWRVVPWERDPVTIVSTWHNDPEVAEKESNERACRDGWCLNTFQIVREADALLVYAEYKDRLSGTLVEIGMALGNGIPVHLVGNYEWASWRYHPLVKTHATLREAVADIVREHNLEVPLGVSEGDST